jgi:hypothetical protein
MGPVSECLSFQPSKEDKMTEATEDHRAAAERWLLKAIQMEDEGKPASLVSKALDKACDYENLANGKGAKAAA